MSAEYIPTPGSETRHADLWLVHCLHTLRQAVMCQGDASLMTMKWGTTDPVPLANSNSPHQCVDWSALDGWAESRYVNVYEPGLVVHPTLGERQLSVS